MVGIELAGSIVVFEDTGCELSSSCLKCPFDYCMTEEPRERANPHPNQIRHRENREKAVALRRQGLTPDSIAIQIGVSKRTAWRLVQGVK